MTQRGPIRAAAIRAAAAVVLRTARTISRTTAGRAASADARHGRSSLLADEGLDSEAPDLNVLQNRAQESFKAFLRTAADAVGENGLFLKD